MARWGSREPLMARNCSTIQHNLGDLMSFRMFRTTSAFCLCLFLLLILSARLNAQAPANDSAGAQGGAAAGPKGGLTGSVTDPSGAGIPKASVRLTDANGASYDATTSREGVYEFKSLAPGSYTLKAVAKGFALFTQEDVRIAASQVQRLSISLTIQIEEQKVEVTDTTTKVDVDPSNNAGTVVMKGKDLEALSDDPDELQSELLALAGPSAGPNGGQIYIDGSPAGSFRRKPRFARSASIRIRSLR